MRVPHDALVMVADGRKLLLFHNEGDADLPKLTTIHAEVQDNPSDSAQGSDEPGRTFSGQAVSSGRSAYSEADHHQLGEDRFAADAADMLRREALAGRFETLIVVAPPRTLGTLRKHYHKEVEKRVAAEIAKDLTGHPVERIEALLVASE